MAALVALTGSALADGVASRNTVGYTTEDHSEYRVQTIQFWAVGASGQEADLTELIEADTIGEYSDELQIYNPDNGIFVTHLWDGTQWVNTDTDDPVDIGVIPGNAFLVVSDAPWTIKGEVPEMTSYDHPIEAGTYFVVGNAYPIAATVGDFDWSEIAEYEDELQIYDADTGIFVTHLWDGTQWVNTDTDAPLSADTELSDGFLILTNLDTITQNFPTND
ncbi:MAG: hypothetical protein IKR48_05170 [Kiritimatiellae bacterium]|nr:hypothetical protein [Kiritimatiellia bacterium]